jgi:hypothetical protein
MQSIPYEVIRFWSRKTHRQFDHPQGSLGFRYSEEDLYQDLCCIVVRALDPANPNPYDPMKGSIRTFVSRICNRSALGILSNAVRDLKCETKYADANTRYGEAADTAEQHDREVGAHSEDQNTFKVRTTASSAVAFMAMQEAYDRLSPFEKKVLMEVLEPSLRTIRAMEWRSQRLGARRAKEDFVERAAIADALEVPRAAVGRAIHNLQEKFREVMP